MIFTREESPHTQNFRLLETSALSLIQWAHEETKEPEITRGNIAPQKFRISCAFAQMRQSKSINASTSSLVAQFSPPEAGFWEFLRTCALTGQLGNHWLWMEYHGCIISIWTWPNFRIPFAAASDQSFTIKKLNRILPKSWSLIDCPMCKSRCRMHFQNQILLTQAKR